MRAERSLMFWRQLAAMRAEPFAAVPDAELLSRYTASRDEAAFEELARRHGGMVWAVCRQLLSDPADAEDAFQAVFLAFVKSSGRVRHGNVGAWLHGTAVRGAMKFRRGAVRARQRDQAAARPEATTTPGDWNELLTAVHEEVGRLPEALRTAFVVCDLEGVPQPDAATRLGWKAGTLTGRLSKARKRLLDALTKRGMAPAATLGLLGLSAATTSADVPLKLLVTVLNFPSAAPGTIPATLAALSLEIMPMTLSKMKLLAVAAMLTCGLAAGTGTVLVPMADAQGPPAATPRLAPLGASAPVTPPNIEPQDKLDFAVKKGMEVPAGQYVYKYLPRPKGSVPLGELSGLLHTEGFNGGWEFAGAVSARMTEKQFQTISGTLSPASTDKLGDYEVFVFKKNRTPAKQAPVTLTDSKGGLTLTANGFFAGAFDEQPTPNPAVCTTAFTVTETPENGVTVTYTYKPGEVVAYRHLRYAGKNTTTAPATTVNPPKPEPARTPPPMLTRPETRIDPSSNAAPPVKPLAQSPAPDTKPAPIMPAVNNTVISPGDFQVTMVGSDGAQGTSFYRRGDAVPPHHASFMPKPKDELLPPPVIADMLYSRLPPVAVTEPAVIDLKFVSAEAVVALCKEVLPKSVRVMALPRSDSVVVINATASELQTLQKLLKIIDTPGKNQPAPQLYQPEPVFPLSRQPDVIRDPESRDLQPLPPAPGTPQPSLDIPSLPSPRIEPVRPQAATSPKPEKKSKTKAPQEPTPRTPERIHGGTT